ncbi:Mur ligase family protein [Patescibacteria group bacterium]
MNTPDWYNNKKVTVMGLGRHGGALGVAKWLAARGARLIVTDLKGEDELRPSVAELERAVKKARAAGVRVPKVRYALGRHDEADFRNVDLVYRNPAVRRNNKYLKLARKSGAAVETEASLFMQLCPYPVTAITGTKGKSTTTALLAEMARRHDRRTAVGGNIRISPFSFLDRLLRAFERGDKPMPVILEMSSWHLEGLEQHRLSPHIAVVTNIREDHLNTYDGLHDYVKAKSIILAYQGADDVAVTNEDDPRVARMGRGKGSWPRDGRFGGRRFGFSRRDRGGNGCYVRGGQVRVREGGPSTVQQVHGRTRFARSGQATETALFPLSSVRLRGEHNVENVLAATAAARAMGLPKRAIAAGVAGFRGVPGRLEEVAVIAGVRYVNDTTATMPDASVAAMEAYGGAGRRIVLIAGGADKELRYGEWGRVAAKRVRVMVLLDGAATPKLERALKRAGFRGETLRAKSMGEATRLAAGVARRGDTVLMSPACSSFGMFRHEFDRGDRFVRAVKKLRKK